MKHKSHSTAFEYRVFRSRIIFHVMHSNQLKVVVIIDRDNNTNAQTHTHLIYRTLIRENRPKHHCSSSLRQKNSIRKWFFWISRCGKKYPIAITKTNKYLCRTKDISHTAYAIIIRTNNILYYRARQVCNAHILF